MLAIKQDERFAVVRGNALERMPEQSLLFPADRQIVRKGAGSRSLVDRLERFRGMGRLTPVLPERIGGQIAGNAAKPGAQFLRLAQAGQLFPGREKCLLGQVFALAQAPRSAVGNGAYQSLIAGYDPAE